MARFRKGDHKVQCDLTGAIVNASDCKLQWDGLFVQKRFWRPRQPQDTISPIREQAVPAINRPFGDPEFLTQPMGPTGITAGDGTGYTWSDGTKPEWSAGAEE